MTQDRQHRLRAEPGRAPRAAAISVHGDELGQRRSISPKAELGRAQSRPDLSPGPFGYSPSWPCEVSALKTAIRQPRGIPVSKLGLGIFKIRGAQPSQGVWRRAG